LNGAREKDHSVRFIIMDSSSDWRASKVEEPRLDVMDEDRNFEF